MATSDSMDSEPEYQQSTRVYWEDVEGEELHDLVMREIRTRIAAVVGLNTNPNTYFGKRELNSIYAYIVGENYFPKWLYNTARSPPIGELRVAVAQEAPIQAYVTSPEELEEGIKQPERPYRRHELIQLAAAVENMSDSRPRPDDNE